MRKLLWVVAVVALVLTVAAPAMALEFKFGAQYRVRWTTGTNIASAPNVFRDIPNSNPRSVQLRVRPIFDVSDDNGNIQARLRLEVGDIEFGNGGGPSGETNGVSLSGGGTRFGPSSGGGFGADGVNVETKSAYLDWAMPFGIPLRVRAGIQPWYLPKGLIVDEDVAGVRAYGTVKPISYEAFWYRLAGGPNRNTPAAPPGAQAPTVATSNTLDNNYDIYGGKFDFAIAPWLNPGIYGLYADNRTNCTAEGGAAAASATALGNSPTCPDRVRTGYWFGFTATGTVSIVKYDLDFVYGSTEGGSTGAFGGAATPVDVRGFAADAAVHFPIGPVTINIAGTYATGDKQNGGKSEAYPTLAASWNGPGNNFELIGSGGEFDQVEYTQDSPANLWAVGASVEYVPVKALWLRVGYAFAGFSTNSGNCAVAPGPCYGPVYNARVGKSSLGHEIHLRADYTIWTGFKLQAQGGWLIPAGDDPPGINAKTAAEYVFQMVYNF
jgi:hypothetical protein